MYKMLTRSQTKMNSNMPIKSEIIVKSVPAHKPESKSKSVVVTQQRMITRSQARQVDEDEVITLHVNPSKNSRIIKDDVVAYDKKSNEIDLVVNLLFLIKK